MGKRRSDLVHAAIAELCRTYVHLGDELIDNHQWQLVTHLLVRMEDITRQLDTARFYAEVQAEESDR